MTDFTILRVQLEKEQQRLNKELKEHKAHFGQKDENREGSPFGKKEEDATEVFELERKLALENKLTDYLAEINHAMEKFDAGTYGICEHCSQPIELARLEALPTATLCLGCKALKDKKGRLR